MFIFSVLNETQRAKAFVLWSPKIHAPRFPALARPSPVPWCPRGWGVAAGGGLGPGPAAGVRGEAWDEL